MDQAEFLRRSRKISCRSAGERPSYQKGEQYSFKGLVESEIPTPELFLLDPYLPLFSPLNYIKNPNFLKNSKLGFYPVEGGGFEPPVHFAAYDSLANCWFKPLTQPSKSLQI